MYILTNYDKYQILKSHYTIDNRTKKAFFTNPPYTMLKIMFENCYLPYLYKKKGDLYKLLKDDDSLEVIKDAGNNIIKRIKKFRDISITFDNTINKQVVKFKSIEQYYDKFVDDPLIIVKQSNDMLFVTPYKGEYKLDITKYTYKYSKGNYFRLPTNFDTEKKDLIDYINNRKVIVSAHNEYTKLLSDLGYNLQSDTIRIRTDKVKRKWVTLRRLLTSRDIHNHLTSDKIIALPRLDSNIIQIDLDNYKPDDIENLNKFFDGKPMFIEYNNKGCHIYYRLFQKIDYQAYRRILSDAKRTVESVDNKISYLRIPKSLEYSNFIYNDTAYCNYVYKEEKKSYYPTLKTNKKIKNKEMITYGNRYNVISKLVPLYKYRGYNAEEVCEIIKENHFISSKDIEKHGWDWQFKDIITYYNKLPDKAIESNKCIAPSEYIVNNYKLSPMEEFEYSRAIKQAMYRLGYKRAIKRGVNDCLTVYKQILAMKDYRKDETYTSERYAIFNDGVPLSISLFKKMKLKMNIHCDKQKVIKILIEAGLLKLIIDDKGYSYNYKPNQRYDLNFCKHFAIVKRIIRKLKKFFKFKVSNSNKKNIYYVPTFLFKNSLFYPNTC